MIDPDHIDDLRARSAAERDARRYRRLYDGVIYRVHSPERGPNELCVLAPVSGTGPTLRVSAGDLDTAFTRCDAGAPAVHAVDWPNIPTPAELRAKTQASDTAAAEALARRVAHAIATEWSTSNDRVKVSLTNESGRTVKAVMDLFAARGWDVIELQNPRGLSIVEAAP